MRSGLPHSQERCHGRRQVTEKNQAQRVVMRVERHGICCAPCCLIRVSSVWLTCSSTAGSYPGRLSAPAQRSGVPSKKSIVYVTSSWSDSCRTRTRFTNDERSSTVLSYTRFMRFAVSYIVNRE